MGSGTGRPTGLGTDGQEARDSACLTHPVAATIGDAPSLGKVAALGSGHPQVRTRQGKAGRDKAVWGGTRQCKAGQGIAGQSRVGWGIGAWQGGVE